MFYLVGRPHDWLDALVTSLRQRCLKPDAAKKLILTIHETSFNIQNTNRRGARTFNSSFYPGISVRESDRRDNAAQTSIKLMTSVQTKTWNNSFFVIAQKGSDMWCIISPLEDWCVQHTVCFHASLIIAASPTSVRKLAKVNEDFHFRWLYPPDLVMCAVCDHIARLKVIVIDQVLSLLKPLLMQVARG